MRLTSTESSNVGPGTAVRESARTAHDGDGQPGASTYPSFQQPELTAIVMISCSSELAQMWQGHELNTLTLLILHENSRYIGKQSC